MTTGSHTFGIAIPENWTEYDLHGDTLAERRAEMLRHAPQKETRDAINHTFRSARRIMEGARRRGAVYAAGTTAMYEDGLLMAGLMVFSVKPPPGEDFSAKGIAEQFSATGRRRENTTRTLTTATLPGVGPVGRMAGIEETEISDGVSYKMVMTHTFVPVPGGERVLVITCFSPNIPLAEPLYDLFDAITSTFALGEKEPLGAGAATT
ncbi:hypothetical protein OHU11_35545 [Streptomyces sp. NBC_00257]|uniref:hypothetical protein n=1 Tax=unclassified Streptomyces TaxID=2593676 RepID=UPI002253908D|nr:MULTISPECIES: hypothetical protein [unclassified Streptomyces]WTB53138.1 hypothetical protein OG832_08145 [Streptomyces sp. NBC_00826]WTH93971.1 hypothetical protein OIC43_35545 [Streptomyces sp. NBC_00825]WTI02706.1 hypothetical protein OHA23_35525 [Streptomyces sp. NBC_00822]MCX4868356.1 hypothetical protein [Streptomyces sp. NBC_00906]MCX4899594.1 hypothetical protein [Streptomyces sp. NBC_00892]